MQPFLLIALFVVTALGGSVPLWLRQPEERGMQLLLAFSGSALLGITFLHLVPESFVEMGGRAGGLVLAGFFLQLLVQRLTHGVEHGHVHAHAPGARVPLLSILAGLALHAFMEGLPLGIVYRDEATTPSLFIAVGLHKIPEAILAASLTAAGVGKRKAAFILVVFAAVTPLAALASHLLRVHYLAMRQIIDALVPLVAGAFLHIATTIFYESGTRHHHLTVRKGIAIVAGIALALATLLFE